MTSGPFLERRAFDPRLLWRESQPVLECLDIELTERCNNRCVHCCVNLPEHDAHAEARELGTAEWKHIIAEAADLGALSIRFTGGEPLLRWDFADLYEFTRRLGVRVTLLTNARLITPELCELLVRIPAREAIEITVYGMSAGAYEAVSGIPGSFDECWRGIGLLLEHGIPFIPKWVMLPQNAGEFAAFRTWAATLPDAVDPPPFATVLCMRTRRDSETRNRAIASLRMNPADVVAALSAGTGDYLRQTEEFCSRFLGPGTDRLFACGATRTISVDPYGVLQPCLLLRMPEVCYDLKRGSLRDAMTTFFPAVRERSATNLQFLERCARCILRGLCEQCPAKSWAEHGTLDMPVEYLCWIAHEEAERIGLLGPGERAWALPDGAGRLRAFSMRPEIS